MSDQKPFAFVLMPFSAEFDDVYKLGIQAAAEEQGVIAQRVDEQFYSETMLERIYRQIDSADFIIADMTGRNPNVFYEVGYAHAKSKLCTLLTRDADDIPFDLKQHRHLVYGNSIRRLKELLASEISWLKTQVSEREKKVITIDFGAPWGYISKTDYSDTANVFLTFDVHNSTDKVSPSIEAIYLHTGSGWTFLQDDKRCDVTASEMQLFKLRHFLRAPLTRLPPGGWAQLSIKGTKPVWTSYGGAERKEKYDLTGTLSFIIATSEGNFVEKLNIELSVDENPF